MYDKTSPKKLTAEEAQKMLKIQGMELTLEQATEILAFLRKLAGIAVSNYLESKDGKPE